jgi:hypothetical protein
MAHRTPSLSQYVIPAQAGIQFISLIQRLQRFTAILSSYIRTIDLHFLPAASNTLLLLEDRGSSARELLVFSRLDSLVTWEENKRNPLIFALWVNIQKNILTGFHFFKRGTARAEDKEKLEELYDKLFL